MNKLKGGWKTSAGTQDDEVHKRFEKEWGELVECQTDWDTQKKAARKEAEALRLLEEGEKVSRKLVEKESYLRKVLQQLKESEAARVLSQDRLEATESKCASLQRAMAVMQSKEQGLSEAGAASQAQMAQQLDMQNQKQVQELKIEHSQCQLLHQQQ